jgi:hypothetical protein
MKKTKTCSCGEEVILRETRYDDGLLSIGPTYLGTCEKCGSLVSDDPDLLSTGHPKRKVESDEIVLRCDQRLVDGQIESLNE